MLENEFISSKAFSPESATESPQRRKLGENCWISKRFCFDNSAVTWMMGNDGKNKKKTAPTSLTQKLPLSRPTEKMKANYFNFGAKKKRPGVDVWAGNFSHFFQRRTCRGQWRIAVLIVESNSRDFWVKFSTTWDVSFPFFGWNSIRVRIRKYLICKWAAIDRKLVQLFFKIQIQTEKNLNLDPDVLRKVVRRRWSDMRTRTSIR